MERVLAKQYDILGEYIEKLQQRDTTPSAGQLPVMDDVDRLYEKKISSSWFTMEIPGVMDIQRAAAGFCPIP